MDDGLEKAIGTAIDSPVGAASRGMKMSRSDHSRRVSGTPAGRVSRSQRPRRAVELTWALRDRSRQICSSRSDRTERVDQKRADAVGAEGVQQDRSGLAGDVAGGVAEVPVLRPDRAGVAVDQGAFVGGGSEPDSLDFVAAADGYEEQGTVGGGGEQGW